VKAAPYLIMASLIPWSEFEEAYAQNFSTETGELPLLRLKFT
jgi:hypothetical protein